MSAAPPLAPPAVRPNADAPFVLHGLPFPARVGPFVRGGVRDYEAEAPGLGHSVAYHFDAADGPGGGPGDATVTAYLYPAAPRPEPPDGPDAAAWREAGLVMEEFRHAVEAGFYAEAAYQGHRWLEVGDAARFLLVEVLVRPPDKDPDADERHGAVCLTWLRGRFLKVRITSSTREETREHAVRFPAALLAALGLVVGVTAGPAGTA